MSLLVALADPPGAARDRVVAALRAFPDIEVRLVDDVAALEDAVAATHVDVAVVAIDRTAAAAGAIERLVNRHRTRVVLLATAGDPMVAQGLAAGALGVVARPVGGGAERRFVDVVRSLSTVQVMTRHPARPPRPAVDRPVGIVAVVASTGGPAALVQVLRALPEQPPAPVLIVQHIADGFAAGLADWLTSEVPQRVRLAAPGHRPVAGDVLLAPDGSHMTLHRGAVHLRDDPPVHGHRPSASVLLHSLVDRGPAALAVVLTGMGSDGADGAVAMRGAGAHVLCQDRQTSVVDGMPAAAVAVGAATEVLPLAEVGPRVARLLQVGRAGGR